MPYQKNPRKIKMFNFSQLLQFGLSWRNVQAEKDEHKQNKHVFTKFI